MRTSAPTTLPRRTGRRVAALLPAALLPAALLGLALETGASAAPRLPLPAPPPPPPAVPAPRTTGGSDQGSYHQGDRIVINGQSQQALWRWLGPLGSRPRELWLPLEVLQNQLGVSSRSRPDGSLDLEWFGRPLLVPPNRQRSLDDEVALDALPLLEAVGVGLQPSERSLSLTLPEARLLGVRSAAQPAAQRVVLDLAAPALVRSSGSALVLNLDARPDQLAQLTSLGLVVSRDPAGLALRPRSGPVSRMFTLGEPNRVVIDIPGGGATTGPSAEPGPIDPAVQALIGRTLRWDRLTRQGVRINAVRMDPRTAPLQLRPLVRPGGMEGLNSLVQLAAQTNARVAINGGYFNRVRRLPLGALKLDGRWMSGPILNRGVAAWSGRELPRFGRLRLEEWVAGPDGRRFPIVVSNSGYVQRGISLYTAAWGPSYRALSGSETALVVEADGQVSRGFGSLELERGVPLGAGQTLLVGRGGVQLPWPSGSRLQLTSRPSDPLGQELQVIGGGPLLLQNGRIALNGSAENFSASFLRQGAPRTVLGSDGREVWLITLEGTTDSGPTLSQTAQLLLQLGLRDALNLDGGSSTGLVLGGSHQVKGRGVAGSVHNGVGLVP
ncbi:MULTISPECIES: phosphodiester glycosidase family protein [Aphanothece]|uniref:phosphodiester glycosidase family protein n=1 Tax=Aphanothece TaxID=1121 RepID=UPI0039847F6E